MVLLAPSAVLRGGRLFFFKQKTAYEMRISDWSSDVCSPDLLAHRRRLGADAQKDRAEQQEGHDEIDETDADEEGPAGRGHRGKGGGGLARLARGGDGRGVDRKSTRLNSSH